MTEQEQEIQTLRLSLNQAELRIIMLERWTQQVIQMFDMHRDSLKKLGKYIESVDDYTRATRESADQWGNL